MDLIFPLGLLKQCAASRLKQRRADVFVRQQIRILVRQRRVCAAKDWRWLSLSAPNLRQTVGLDFFSSYIRTWTPPPGGTVIQAEMDFRGLESSVSGKSLSEKRKPISPPKKPTSRQRLSRCAGPPPGGQLSGREMPRP